MNPTCTHPDCLTPCNDDDYCRDCCAYVCPEHRTHQHPPDHDPTAICDPAEHWAARWHDDP